MNRRTTALAAALLLASAVAIPARLSANDSEAVLEGGSIVLIRSDAIAMEEEDLYISPSEVRVAYKFRNTTDSTIETRVAFPVRIETYDGETRTNESFVRGIAFQLHIDGVERPFDHEIRTATTGQHSIDSIEVIFHWTMSFPANSVVEIRHAYHTQGGMITPPADEKEFWRAFIAEHCIESSLRNWMYHNPSGCRPVPYILRTGANWSGPIKRFKLTIHKESAKQKLAVCMKGLRKIDARTYVFERRNYTPTHDINVLFVTGPDD
jgi:hypothetical protein